MNNLKLVSIREVVQASIPPAQNKRGRPSSNITAAQKRCAEMAGITLRHWQKLELGTGTNRIYTISPRSTELLLIKLAIAGVSIANDYQKLKIDR